MSGPIGVWTFPSGNRVEVSLGPPDDLGIREAKAEWDRWPPSKRDKAYYREVVGPGISAMLLEYMEIPGPGVYVQVVE